MKILLEEASGHDSVSVRENILNRDHSEEVRKLWIFFYYSQKKTLQTRSGECGQRKTFAHLVCFVQRCEGQRQHSVSASAPVMWICTASLDIQGEYAPLGNENCCGRVSLTSSEQRGQPAGMTLGDKRLGHKRSLGLRDTENANGCNDQGLTLEPQGKSFFQGVRFSVQTISRGRVA